MNIQPVKKFSKYDPPEKNPWGIDDVPYEKPLVDFVDALVALAKAKDAHRTIERDTDWEVLDFIMKGWLILYPVTAKEFLDHMKEWRRQSKRLGVSREGEAMLQHKFNVPRPVYDMIKAIYPDQIWDKKFVLKFANRYFALRGSDKL